MHEFKPQVASKACAGGSTDLVMDVSASYDPSGRPIKSVEWRVMVDSPTNSSVLDAFTAALNAQPGFM